MSYEREMLIKYGMPSRQEVEQALLKAIFKRGGHIKEFGQGQDIVDELADEFRLTEPQRTVALQTVYRKENRPKQSLLWHRLLFRAANALANGKLVSRPSQTFKLTQEREWMLLEKGFDEALRLLNIPIGKKDSLPTKSYEVQKIVKKLQESPRPENYNPFDSRKKVAEVTRESILRTRGFRQAIVEVYNCRCAVCGLKIHSPDCLSWEVEAAHFVPHNLKGRDDIWNGVALCHLHHWAFDVGWFALQDHYTIQVSSQIHSLPSDFGKLGNYNFIRSLSSNDRRLISPSKIEFLPHHSAIRWHRQNIFHP